MAAEVELGATSSVLAAGPARGSSPEPLSLVRRVRAGAAPCGIGVGDRRIVLLDLVVRALRRAASSIRTFR
jgi:hypothetical protein